MTTPVGIMSEMGMALALVVIIAMIGIAIAIDSICFPRVKPIRKINVRRDIVEPLVKLVSVALLLVACIAALFFVRQVWEESQKFADSRPPWKMAVATGSTPVTLDDFASPERCEAERIFRIKEAYEAHRNIPALECIATFSWGERLHEGWIRALEALKSQ